MQLILTMRHNNMGSQEHISLKIKQRTRHAGIHTSWSQWPHYRTYFSPEILYYIPYKCSASQTPLKKDRKIRKIFQAKAFQGQVPGLNLKKNFHINFLQYANNIRTLLFRSMHQAQNTDTHALKQLGVSQNSLPLWSNFTAGKHIWYPSWAWMKKSWTNHSLSHC